MDYSTLNLIYALWAVTCVSLTSLIGIVFIWYKTIQIESLLLYLVALAAGTFFGDIFFHIIPEIGHQYGVIDASLWLWIIWGLLIGIVLEKAIRRHHCHHPETHIHPIGQMNIIGEIVHNLIDGMLIGASFMISVEVGIATSIAVLLHEIPQEIWDFGILLHAWYSKTQALVVNFAVSLVAIVWCIFAWKLGQEIASVTLYILALAIGLFIYIAGSDLIPEMHRESDSRKSFLQVMMFILWVWLMWMMMAIEHEEDTHVTHQSLHVTYHVASQ